MRTPLIIKINSDKGEINNFVQGILKELRTAKVDKHAIFDVRLCLEEALVNAASHGNKNDTSLPIKISYSLSEDQFKISIEDNGSGFDYKNLPDPTTEENLLKTKGRGMYLIRYLMDEVAFNNTGSKITMVKDLRGHHEDM